jgi:DNA repair protein RecO (recombination protein O)
VNRRALLLHRAPYGETSLVVEVLSPQDGVRSVLARGAFRPTSRFYAVLDWFDTLELDWRERRGSDLALLDSGDRCVLRRRVATNLAAYRAAHAALDSIRSAARAGRDDGDLFALAERLLDALDVEDTAADLELVAFDLRFLDHLGLSPALEHCATCGREAPTASDGPARSAFSAECGGRLCRACAVRARDEGARVGLLDRSTLETAARLTRSGPGRLELGSGDMLETERSSVRDFVERFLEYHLERRPKARRRLPARRSIRILQPHAADANRPSSLDRPS